MPVSDTHIEKDQSINEEPDNQSQQLRNYWAAEGTLRGGVGNLFVLLNTKQNIRIRQRPRSLACSSIHWADH